MPTWLCGLGSACVWGTLFLAGCHDPLTDAERQLLWGFRLVPVPPSPTNAVADDPRAARLGQQLFFDPRFSGPLLIGSDVQNGGLGPVGATERVACASCHDLVRGGGDTRSRPRATSLGARWGPRNSQSIFNLPYLEPSLHWDGRRDSIWASNLGPYEAPGSHNTTRLQVVHTLVRLYRGPYEAIFGPLPDLSDRARFPESGKPGTAAFDAMALEDRVTVNRIFANVGKVIEAYLRLLVSRKSPFDRFLDGDPEALSPAALRGAQLFVGKAACNECHSGPVLSDRRFHNHGIPQVGPNVRQPDPGRAEGITLVLKDEFNAAGPYSDAPSDRHLRSLVPSPADLGAFRTPPLRGVSQTAPYFHTGAVDTLWEVLVFYRDAAGTDNFAGMRDPAIRPLRLDDGEIADLIAFLRALEGPLLPMNLLVPPELP